MENKHKSAFPIAIEGNSNPNHPEAKGLTKREYFAAMAMQGILANMGQDDSFKVNDWGIDSNRIACNAIECADELLKQLVTK